MRKLRKNRHFTIVSVLLLTGLTSLTLAWLMPAQTAGAATPTPSRELARAVEQAGNSGQYGYRTNIAQTYHPTLSLQNVGRYARTEHSVIEGIVDAPAERMTLQLTAANNAPVQIKIEDGLGYGRLRDDEPWTEVEVGAADLFAPGSDPMGFLVAAENIRIAGEGASDASLPVELLPAALGDAMTRYRFDLSGPKYARFMRDQMEDQLRRQGELPAGLTLQTARHYVEMTGSGEIWVYEGADGRALPYRQTLRIAFPAQAGADEWIEAEITTSYFDWAEQLAQEAMAYAWGADPLGSATALAGAFLAGLPRDKVESAGFTGGTLFILLGLMVWAVLYRQRKAVRSTVYVPVIASMLVVPLLQATQVQAFSLRQAARQENARQTDSGSNPEAAAAFDPHARPQRVAMAAVADTTQAPTAAPATAQNTACVITADSDCDGDGLSDNVELYELGTRIDQIDSDGDGISDGTEVTPFAVDGQDWYLDPLNADTNGDGLSDGAECLGRTDVVDGALVTVLEATCPDSDGDSIPDIHDYDDDGDGVPDSADMAHLESQAVISQTFSLEIAGAAADTNLFVDFQVRPVDERHLAWTNSALNWPDGDTSGQIRRVVTDTLTTDGDMLLIPMLEITIPYAEANPAGGLPISGTATITRTSRLSNWLDTAMLDKYQINVTLSENGDRVVYVPLAQATDPNGGMPVAWQARMPYRLADGIGGWGAAHQVKLIWLVSGQHDSCDAGCTDPANWTSTTKILQTYYDDFIVTGMQVQEHHGAQAMMVAQSVNTGAYEPELWHLADTLQTVYLESQTVNGQRFTLADIPTSYTNWGMSGGSLTFNHITGLADDAALLDAMSGDAVPAFLRTDIYTSDPISGTVAGVMLLSEETQRIRTMGEADSVDNNGEPALLERFVFANNTFQVELGSAALETVGAMRVQNYQYATGLGWDDVPPSAHLEDLSVALEAVLTPAVITEILAGDDVDDLNQARDGALVLAINYYLGFYVAGALPLAIDGVPVGGQALVDSDHLRPSQPVATIVQRLATNLKSYFGQLTLADLDIPTVENDRRAGTAQGWAQLAASRGAVLAGVGEILQGNTASSAALALLEIADYPRLVDGGKLLDLRAYSILNTIIGDYVSGDVVPFFFDGLNTENTAQFGSPTRGGLISAGLYGAGGIQNVVRLYSYDKKIISDLLKPYKAKGVSTPNVFIAIDDQRQYLALAIKDGSPFVSDYRKQLAAAQAYYDSIITTKVKLWELSGLATQIAYSGLTIGIALADGAVQADSPAFSRLVAEQIGAIVVETFIAIITLVALQTATFALSRFVTVLAVIDTVMIAVCALFNLGEDENLARWFCGGISGALAQALAYVINDTTPLVDLQRSDRLDVVLDTPTFGNESGLDGVIVGNSVTLKGTVTNTLYMDDPNWMGYLWWWQWSDDFLDDATFAYRMQQSDQDIALDLQGTSWTPVPGKKPSSISANDARFYQALPIAPLVHTFSAPGVNQGVGAYFSEGFAVQQQNCWLTVVGALVTCWLSEYDDTNHIPLSDRFIFDVLPATIDDFRAVVLEFNNDGRPGYRLAWDNQFPILADADGDGLRSPAMGGLDPDDSTPDADGDGLSDYFELNAKGFEADQADGDCDGLTDYWELFYNTNPARADSDGDGLLDGEEFFHLNRLNPYENSLRSNAGAPACAADAATYTGGWAIVYDYDSNGNPLRTWVNADANDPDSDDDTLTDKQERVYAYNPNVASSLRVLRLDSQVETDSSLQPYVSATGSITYTAVVTNELTLPYARGLLEAELPLDNVLHTQSLGVIAPRTAASLAGTLSVAASGLTGSGPVDMGLRAGAIIDDPTGRALWLHLNEPGGSTGFVDSSFLGNDGACSGDSCPAANGTALTFDGNDVLVVPDDASLDLTQYTLALAVKPANRNSSVLLTKTSGAGSAQNYSLSLSNTGRASFFTYGGCAGEGGIDSIGTPVLPLNRWSHLAATFDGSVKRLYLNGVEVASAAFSGAACLTDDPVTIGGRYAFGDLLSAFTGQIDEVEIYPNALDANTILQRYATSALTVDLRDSTTWGSDAVSCSGAACPSAAGSGATFAQVDYLTAAAPDLSGDAFSFATWIRPEARQHPFDAKAAAAYGKWTDADYQGVFGQRDAWDGNTIYPSLYVGSNGRLRMIWGDGANTCEVSTVNTGVVTLGDWQHLTVSYDGSNLTFYVNGAPIAGGTTGSCAAVTPPTVSTFSIGRPNPFGYVHFDFLDFTDLEDPNGTAGGKKVEMRLNFDNDGSAGNLAWANLDEGVNTTPSWTLNTKKVIGDGANSWFRIWENYDGGCLFDCPEDESSDTNFDQDRKADTNLKQITGIQNTTYLGYQQAGYRYPPNLNTGWYLSGTLVWSNNNDYFQGDLDDFRVYPYALSATLAADLYRSSSVALDLAFDEAPGVDLFADRSGNFVTVACSGASCPTSGVSGRNNQALEFDGVDDYLTIGASTSALGLSEGNFSVMMWIKPDTFRGTNDWGFVPLLDLGNGYNLLLQGYGRLAVAGGGSVFLVPSSKTLYDATHQWYHVAYVYDGGVYRLYVNGQMLLEYRYVGPPATDGLHIGKASYASDVFFDGLMDDLTIVKRALSTTEVQAQINRAPSINLHLDEEVVRRNGVVTDEKVRSFANDSENPAAANCLTASQCPSAGDKGQVREAVTFDGGDILVTRTANQQPLVDFSAGMWVKPTKTINDPQYLMYTDNLTDGTMRLTLPSNSLSPRLESQQNCGGTWDVVNANTPLLKNQWNHVMATRDANAGVLKLYVNGALSGVNSSIGTVGSCGSFINLGWQLYGGMDEVRIGSAVLSDAEVAALYTYQAAWFDVINHHAVYVDAENPTVDLSATPVHVRAGESVQAIMAKDASSPIAVVEYQIDGGAWQVAAPSNSDATTSGSWLYTLPGSAATHTVSARATDVVGNVSALASATVRVDSVDPVVTINGNPGVIQVLDDLTLSGTAGDADSGVAVGSVKATLADHTDALVDGVGATTLQADGNWQTTVSFDPSPYGIYTANASAADEAMNTASATIDLRLDGLPPYADVTDGENFISPSQSKTITGVASDVPYPANGRTLHLHFETGAGVWEDGAGNDFTMQCSGAACPATGVSGKRGAAVAFDGGDDVLDFTSSEIYTATTTAVRLGLLGGSFTAMAWVQAADWSGDHALLGSSPTNLSDGFYLGIRNGSPILGYGGDDTAMSGVIPTGEWVHVAWRYDAKSGERTFFVNGVAGAAPEGTHSAFLSDDVMQVGRARGGNAYGGALDELVVYGKPLDDETIYDIANPLDTGISSLELRVRSYEQRDMGQFAGTWSPITLDAPGALFTTWQTTLPSLGLGAYKIDLRATDSVGNRQYVEGAWDVAVIAPDLAVSKASDVTLADLGDSIGFTIRYTNTGRVAATGVVITETVPVDTRFDAVQSDSGWSCAADAPAGSVCSLDVGDLAAGASGTAAFVVTVASDWSVGATAIDNTVTIGLAGTDAAPEDNLGTTQIPIAAQIDLAVSISPDAAAFEYTTEGSSPVVYTLNYTNTGTQPAQPQLVVEWSRGGDRAQTNSDGDWDCTIDPYTLEGSNRCTLDVGILDAAQSGSAPFTLYTGYFLPESLAVTTTVQIADLAGANEVNTNNNSDLAVTPIQVDYSVILGSTVITVPEGSLATNSGLLLSPPYDPLSPPLFSLFDPSIGEYIATDEDYNNLVWSWVYTSTDGPEQTQVVTWNVGVGDGAFTLKPTFQMNIVNVAPTVAITVPETVAVGQVFDVAFGELIDPGQDTMIDCFVDWGDGTSDYCDSIIGFPGRTLSHKYGPNLVNPTLTVNVEDEDGIFVAASKTLTVTGVAASLSADQSSISGDESETLTNTGTYSPLDATLSWSASEGTVTDEGNGAWSWSLDAGSAEGSRTVTIVAGSQSTTFTVNVQGDGAASDLEDGAPNNGDGNDDGIPDRMQMHVASLPSPVTGDYVTIAVDPGLSLANVSFPATPTAGADTLPGDASFPLGFPTFNVTGMGAGGNAQATLYLADAAGINSYYKYDASNGWFDFMYDDTTATGAELLSDRVNLYFVDGVRGDADLSANGTISDPGGPARQIQSYALTVNISGGGAVSVPSSTHVEGTVLNLAATADPGWTFTGWSGALSGKLTSATLTMDGDKTVTAIFVRTEYSLAVRTVGNGTVDWSPVKGAYLYGDTVTLTTDADLGWSFAGWSGDLGGNSTGETVTIDSSKVVTATFTQNVYTINATGSGGGSVVLSPQLPDYRYGDVVAVEAVPDPGYVFQSWSGVTGDGRGLILVVDGNKSATANFGPASYTISTTVSGGGAIALNPDKATYAYGEVVQVTATPDAEWSFAEWELGLSGSAAVQSLTVTDNTNLQAIFAPTTYSLNVAWIGNGTAQKLTDKTAFTAGEVVSVAATPSVNGGDFAGWRDEESDTFFSTELTTTVTITGNRSVVAVFGTPLYPVTVNVVGSGTVTPTVSAYALGETATLTATAAADWSFSSWSGDVTGVTNPITFTVDAAKVVTATFTSKFTGPISYTLTLNAVGNGTVAPTSGTYTAGSTVPVTATAAAGWAFAGWSGDLTGTTNPTVVTMDADKVIVANFTAVQATQAYLSGSFTLQGWAGDDYAVPLTVKLYPIGSTTPVYEFTPTAWGTSAGQFAVGDIAPGDYQVAVKHANHLQIVATLTLNVGTNDHDFGTLLGADANGDNKVNFLDFSVLSGSWQKRGSSAGYDSRADFNGDNEINALDFSILSSNWNAEGQNPQ